MCVYIMYVHVCVHVFMCVYIMYVHVCVCMCVYIVYVHVCGVISCQVKQHMHLMFQIWLNFSIYIGLHMSSHFPILYVHNLNGCRITQH